MKDIVRDVAESLNILLILVLLGTVVALVCGCKPRSEVPWGTQLVSRACPETQVFADTWTPADKDALNGAKGRCAVKYPNSPCLVRFYKYGPQRYGALCGANKENL